jgi:dipeptidyl aminopeptidase/acylaminoacyl peptidase
MTDRLIELLELRSSVLLDIDGEGRLLVGDDDSGSLQLHQEARDGTRTVLTASTEPCTGRYLPGSRSVAVSTDDGGTERAQLWLLDADHPDAAWRAIATDPQYIHTILDVAPDLVVYATNRRNQVDFDVIVHTVSTGEERVVWDGGGWFDTAAASPDGRLLALRRESLLPASSQLMLADLETGGVEEVTDAGEPGDWTPPYWLGDDVLVSSSDAGEEFHSVRGFDVATRTWTTLVEAEGCDRVGVPSPDGTRLAVVSTQDGADRITVHALAGLDVGEGVAVGLPDAGVVTNRGPLVWAPGSDELGITFESPVAPPDVYTWSADATVARRTAPNDESATAGLVRPDSRKVATPDGEQIPVYVLRRDDGGGSSVLYIHGGPEAASVRSWNPVIAALAVGGHTVVVPNVRGSAGYGRRWVSLDDVGKRMDAVADLAAIHAWLPSIGADPARAALYGGSYGGYLVLAGLAFQPDLWAAGVDIVGISSLVTFLRNTSAYRRAYREKEYGRLDVDLDLLENASPINRIGDVRAPLFVIHGANDPRVPLSEAEQMVAAVRSRGIECELLVYADEGHGLAKRANRLDAYPKTLAFLRRHLA